MTLRPQSSPPFPKSWFLSTRTFWLGLLVTAFFLWLTADSFLYLTAYRTIHRGSLRDWSEESVIAGSVPDESGSFVAQIYGGCIFLIWNDHIAPNASYYGTDERTRLTADDTFSWTPGIFSQADSMLRYRGVRIPTWLFLATWLGIWTYLLLKSARRHRSYLQPEALPPSP
ncbi:hypothetical protein [Haloferula sp. BvORR071]|uniref:hypothetical protein n=1 Tax=Haloferula sp. BvORR071 TaxID=1396141 RepID=UPI0005523AF9|nr:hypothetical protein [Haloferula sp. BvORR071]